MIAIVSRELCVFVQSGSYLAGIDRIATRFCSKTLNQKVSLSEPHWRRHLGRNLLASNDHEPVSLEVLLRLCSLVYFGVFLGYYLSQNSVSLGLSRNFRRFEQAPFVHSLIFRLSMFHEKNFHHHERVDPTKFYQ